METDKIKDEPKKVTKKTGTALDDDKLEQVTGGRSPYLDYFCNCLNPEPDSNGRCKICRGIIDDQSNI